MKDIVIVIPEGEVSAVAITGITMVFDVANMVAGPNFKLKIASHLPVKEIRLGRYGVQVDTHLKDIDRTDLVIIPPLNYHQKEGLERNKELIEWLKWIWTNSEVELGSVCTGAYFLAATGLLDGKEASSHWAWIDELRELFPKVDWVPECIITDTEGLYTSGGTFSSFNLILYLVEKFVNKEVAVRISKELEIDYGRSSQLPFMIFNNQRNHTDERILAVQQFMEKHYEKTIKLDVLAKQFSMSRRNLIRRFKVATGNTPRTYIQRLRIEEAKRILETSESNVSEVMFAVGYTDVNTFRDIFQRYTGFLPSRYKQKFGHGPLNAN
ncbi:MAG: helix-turn-helix domain-containing protein [Saprospiraceae bacterium]